MIAELIAVGTELLLGSIANTDAQFLSEKLSALGITVHHHTVVGDNPQRLSEALETARARADIIITTGGLGPTYDDLTKQTICKTFGRELELHEDILEEIRSWFLTKLGREMPENNIRQALLPAVRPPALVVPRRRRGPQFHLPAQVRFATAVHVHLPGGCVRRHRCLRFLPAPHGFLIHLLPQVRRLFPSLPFSLRQLPQCLR
jgi:molybdenum cofactor synthesis domain-containing protein